MEIKVSDELLKELNETVNISNRLDKKLAIASIITRAFTENNYSPPIIVGGTAVALYTEGLYGTVDTDFIAKDCSNAPKIMSALGYKRLGKDYYNKTIDSYIEFPSSSLSGNYEMIMKYTVEDSEIYVIGIEDLILDRIESYTATNDTGSAEWAKRMLGGMYKVIDWSYLHKEAHSRGVYQQTEKLQREVKRYKEEYMKMIEED